MGFLAWLIGPGVVRTVLFVLVALDVAGLIFNAVFRKKRAVASDEEKPFIRVMLFIPTALYMFFFFVGHFGGFHAGHGFVLSLLVPVELQIPGDLDSLTGARNLFFSFFRVLLTAYWPYVLSVTVKSFFTYRKLFTDEAKENFMLLPYRNVVRIHLLIMVLAPVALAGLGKVVMIIALFFFYFPVERSVAWYRSRRN
jgi:hypothetical protein